MRIGVFYFPVDYGIGIAELATTLEQHGFASLYVPHPYQSRDEILRVIDKYAPLLG